MTKPSDLCTCGHPEEAHNPHCEAIVSGSPNLTKCVCDHFTVPGEHLKYVRPAD
jgi:hypothetical protein